MADQSQILHELNLLRNNFKQYAVGNTYNGVALNITGTSSWVTVRGILRPFRTLEPLSGDIIYKIELNIVGTKAAGSSMTITISGITFKNISNCYQEISSSIPLAVNVGESVSSVALPNTGQITSYYTANATRLTYGGIAELESWPTWAYNII